MKFAILLAGVVLAACVAEVEDPSPMKSSVDVEGLHYLSYDATEQHVAEFLTTNEAGERGLLATDTSGKEFWLSEEDICSPRIIEHSSRVSIQGDPARQVLWHVDTVDGIPMKAYVCTCGGTDTGGCSPFSAEFCNWMGLCKTIEGCTAGCDVCSGHE